MGHVTVFGALFCSYVGNPCGDIINLCTHSSGMPTKFQKNIRLSILREKAGLKMGLRTFHLGHDSFEIAPKLTMLYYVAADVIIQ